MNGIYNNKPLIPINRTNATVKVQEKPNNINGGFGNILEQEISKQSEVKFSKHAQERLLERNIKFSKDDLEKINNAVNKAAEKGVKETLILMNNTAMIASVRNKTIITAATGENLKDNVFTNIDGAVII